jgi:aminoglycoside phosphotransferase family enzyme/predicted kinase
MTHAAEAIEPRPAALVPSLEAPRAFPEDETAREGIERIQTHISHLFLTRERVYKFRKAVVLPFVSFATREQRDADCLREVALNRRLAEDVYLGVAPLRHGRGGLTVGPVSEVLDPEALEHCVVMRRLRAGCDAQSLLEAGKLTPGHIDRFAARVARFHDAARLSPPLAPDVWLERCTRPFEDVVELARGAGCDALDADFLAGFAERVAARGRALASRFAQRRLDGRGVDGHGDLHLQHVWFEQPEGEPIAMDCIEFREDLRCADAAAEVAFPAMDLRYRGHAELAERFLARYAWLRDDFDLYEVVDYFTAYRAAVRGGVAAVASGEDELAEPQRRAAAESAAAHLRLASELLASAAGGAGLVAMAGTVGSGKSTAARRVADALGAVVIGSDRTRKSLAGLAPTETAGPECYDAAWNERVYAAILERAAHALDAGRWVVLDATYSRRADRKRLLGWAASRGIVPYLVETQCDPAVARERLAARARGTHGETESDAGPELLDQSIERFEAPDEWPAGAHVAVDTTAAGWGDGLAAAVRGWLAPGR